MTKICRQKHSCSVLGVSLLEVLLAVVIFVMGFVPLLRLFSESGLSQQRMVRDFPVTVSIIERLMITIENEIQEGRFDPAAFAVADPDGVDVTESVLESRAVNSALEKFYGEDSKKAARFVNKCRIFLKTEPYSEPGLIAVKVMFLWKDSPSSDKDYKHKVELFRLIRRT
ncbi:MAG: type IV pilus modification PilV family protein [Candidatus Rifleibacteriota bacterium]